MIPVSFATTDRDDTGKRSKAPPAKPMRDGPVANNDRHGITLPFKDLGLSEPVLKAVSDAGYVTPTPIQARAIPKVLQGLDIMGCAQTGTGKTAGFTLPMIDVLQSGRARARMPRSLILEPTRELAAQVSENFDIYGKYCNLSKALLIGGVSFEDQAKIIDRGADVLIATPGRLLDHFERGGLLMRGVEILVIDEADRMLDMGFIPDVKLTNPKRQTLFFSATMSPEMRRIAAKFLNDPIEIEVAPPASPAATVDQSVTFVNARDKRKALRHLLRTQNVKTASATSMRSPSRSPNMVSTSPRCMAISTSRTGWKHLKNSRTRRYAS